MHFQENKLKSEIENQIEIQNQLEYFQNENEPKRITFYKKQSSLISSKEELFQSASFLKMSLQQSQRQISSKQLQPQQQAKQNPLLFFKLKQLEISHNQLQVFLIEGVSKNYIQCIYGFIQLQELIQNITIKYQNKIQYHKEENQINALLNNKMLAQLPNNIDLQQIYKIYQFDVSKDYPINKNASMGRCLTRSGSLKDGIIFQNICGKSNRFDSSLRKTKQKAIKNCLAVIESRQKFNKKLKWVSGEQYLCFNYRILFINQQNTNKLRAIYTDLKSDAIKMRDYCICCDAIKNQNLDLAGFVNYIVKFYRRVIFSQQFRIALQKYSEFRRTISEKSLEESPVNQQDFLTHEKRKNDFFRLSVQKLQEENSLSRSNQPAKPTIFQQIACSSQQQIKDNQNNQSYLLINQFKQNNQDIIIKEYDTEIPSLPDFKTTQKGQNQSFEDEILEECQINQLQKSQQNNKIMKENNSIENNNQYRILNSIKNQKYCFPLKKKNLNFQQLKQYDSIFITQFHFYFRNLLDRLHQQNKQEIKHTHQKEVRIQIIFEQLQIEFYCIYIQKKNTFLQKSTFIETNIIKPKLRIEVKNPNNQNIMMEVKCKILDIQSNKYLYELQSNNNILQQDDSENLNSISTKSISLTVLDEITHQIIAKETMNLSKIVNKEGGFMNKSIFIEPSQILNEALNVNLIFSSIITKKEEFPDIKNLDDFLYVHLQTYNYYFDNYYKTKIYIDKFSPNQFKILIQLLEFLGVNIVSLKLQIRKQNNKIDCYRSFRMFFIKHYIEQQQHNQNKLRKNIKNWNIFQEKIAIKSSQQSNILNKERLDASDSFIKNDALDQNQHQNEQCNKKRVVSSIFYKIDLWECNPKQQQFYKEMKSLIKQGIPNQSRENVWFQIGKLRKYLYVIERQLNNLEGISTQNNSNFPQISLIYHIIQQKSYQMQSDTIFQFQKDLERITTRYTHLTYDEFIAINEVFYMFIWLAEQNKQIIYSKYQIPFAIKSLYYFRSLPEEEEEDCKQNVLSLVLCLAYSFNRKYYNQKQVKNNQLCPEIKTDCYIFLFYFEKYNGSLFCFLNTIGFSLFIFFAENVLEMFSLLFNEEMLFRLWDVLFFESNSSNAHKITYFSIAILINFLSLNANLITLYCKNCIDVDLLLKTSGKFYLNCDEFINGTYAVYEDILKLEQDKFTIVEQKQESKTKKIFNSIVNISKSIISSNVNQYLEQVSTSYKQLDMHKFTTQNVNISYMLQQKQMSYNQILEIISNSQNKYDISNASLSYNKSFQSGKNSSFQNQNSQLKQTNIYKKILLYIQSFTLVEFQNNSIQIKVIHANVVKIFQTSSIQTIKILEHFDYNYPNEKIFIEIYKIQDDSYVFLMQGYINTTEYEQNKLITDSIVLLKSSNILNININFLSEVQFTILITSSNIKQSSQRNQSYDFNDKYNYVPVIFQIRKNIQCELKLKAYNQIKQATAYERVSNQSLQSIKSQWKEKNVLSVEEFVDIFGFKNADQNWMDCFCSCDKVHLYDFLVSYILNDNKILTFEKQFLIAKMLGKSQPVQLLSFLQDFYAKYKLYIPFNQLQQLLKVKNIPYLIKAKFYVNNGFDILPNTANKNRNEQKTQQQCFDVIFIVRQFFSQQLQFKGSCSFYLDSPKFITYLNSQISEIYKCNSIKGKLQIVYWSKGQKRFFQTEYQQNGQIKEQCERQVINNYEKQNIVLQNGFELLQFNDNLLKLDFDDSILSEQCILQTIESLPLIDYFNNLQKINENPISKPNNNPVIWIKMVFDGQQIASFKLNQRTNQLSDILNTQLSQNQILKNWKMLRKQNKITQHYQQEIVQFLNINIFPLYWKIHQIGQFISYQVMQACINAVQETTSNNQQFLHLYSILSSLNDLSKNLENVKLTHSDQIYALDQSLSLQENQKKHSIDSIMLNQDQICLTFHYNSNYNELETVNFIDAVQTYALFFFKQGLSQWLKCKVHGFDSNINQSLTFIVEFVDYPFYIFCRTENEVCFDQDMDLPSLNIAQFISGLDKTYKQFNDDRFNNIYQFNEISQIQQNSTFQNNVLNEKNTNESDIILDDLPVHKTNQNIQNMAEEETRCQIMQTNQYLLEK